MLMLTNPSHKPLFGTHTHTLCTQCFAMKSIRKQQSAEVCQKLVSLLKVSIYCRHPVCTCVCVSVCVKGNLFVWQFRVHPSMRGRGQNDRPWKTSVSFSSGCTHTSHLFHPSSVLWNRDFRDVRESEDLKECVLCVVCVSTLSRHRWCVQNVHIHARAYL